MQFPKSDRSGPSMPRCLDPHLAVLPRAQRDVWSALAPAAPLSFVLYGGTAIALHLGHRHSVDFDFFRAKPLEKDEIRWQIEIVSAATPLQDQVNTLVV